jgi:hypothetical protein
VGDDVLAQFRRDFEGLARNADAIAKANDLRRKQAVALRHARAEEVARLIEAIGAALSRPPLPYVKFKILHRFGSQPGASPITSWAGELKWTGAGSRRSLRLEVSQADGMLRWYWSAEGDLQVEEAVDIDLVSGDLVKSLVAAITEGETFDGGQVPRATISRTRRMGSRRLVR